MMTPIIEIIVISNPVFIYINSFLYYPNLIFYEALLIIDMRIYGYLYHVIVLYNYNMNFFIISKSVFVLQNFINKLE